MLYTGPNYQKGAGSPPSYIPGVEPEAAIRFLQPVSATSAVVNTLTITPSNTGSGPPTIYWNQWGPDKAAFAWNAVRAGPNGCFGFGDDPSPALPGVTQIQAGCIRTNESTGQAYFGNLFFLEHDTSNPSHVWFIYLNYTPQDGWKVLQTTDTNEILSGQGWNTGCE